MVSLSCPSQCCRCSVLDQLKVIQGAFRAFHSTFGNMLTKILQQIETPYSRMSFIVLPQFKFLNL